MLQAITISLDGAQQLITEGIVKAKEIGSLSNIAVVDSGGNLVAHVRMNGAQIGSIEHSINKAFTSVACQRSTLALGEDAQPSMQFYGIAGSIGGRVIVFADGIPLYFGGQLVGGLSVSGGSTEKDQAIAEAAVTVL